MTASLTRWCVVDFLLCLPRAGACASISPSASPSIRSSSPPLRLLPPIQGLKKELTGPAAKDGYQVHLEKNPWYKAQEG